MNNLSTVVQLTEKGFQYFVANLNASHLSALSTVFETGVIHSECKKNEVAQHHQKIQLIFNTVNAAWIAWEAYLIASNLAISFEASTLLVDSAIPMALAFAAVAGITLLGPKLLSENPSLEKALEQIPANERESINVGFDRPFSHRIAQYQYSARAVTNIALLYFSPKDGLIFGLNLCGSLYNLYNISQLKWLEFNKHFQGTALSLFERVTFTYSSLLMKGKSESCGICLGDAVDTYFCEKHVFDIGCLTVMLHESSKKLGTSETYILPTDHITNGMHSRSYAISLPSKNVFACPACTTTPPQLNLGAKVEDRTHKTISASVAILDPRKTPSWLGFQFFERLNVVYNTFQAGLSGLQYDLMNTLRFYQNALFIVDMTALVRDAISFYDQMHQQLKTDLDPQKRFQINVKFLLGCIAVATLSGVAMVALNQYFAPPLDPNEFFAKMPLNNITACWDNDWVNKVWQTTLLARIAVNMGSLAFSKNRYLKLANIGLIGLTLYNTSQLPWLKLNFKGPAELPSDLSQLDTTAYFILPSASNIPSNLQKIYDYTTSIFKGSSWYSYWYIQTYNGIETSRDLYYIVTLKTKSLLDPYLDSLQGTVFGYFNRATATLNFRFAK